MGLGQNGLSLGILVSGNGTNLQAIIDATLEGRLEAKLKLVLSDQPDAFALKRAEKHRIPHEVVDRKKFPNREAFEERVIEHLETHKVNLVVLAGFMHLLSASFINRTRGRIVNIHPSLLPAFPGLKAVRQALEGGVRYTGCTVHFVDEGVDNGPIIGQSVVPVLETDTEEELAERTHTEERKLYPAVLKLLAEGRVTCPQKGRRVVIRGGSS